MIVRNKMLFQSAAQVVWMAQSRCQEHDYPVMLHAVPLIIMCNDWLLDAREDEAEHVSWCQANSVLVQVTRPLWKEPGDGGLPFGPAHGR